VLEFRAGNQLSSYAVVIDTEEYRLAGTDTILLRHGGGREEKLELEWDNADRARIDDEAAGKSIELVRAGNAPGGGNPLTGEWSTKREWKGASYPARALFLAGGKVVWTIELRAESGRYSAEAEKIRLEIPNRPVVEGQFSLTGDRLLLPNPKGGQSGFERY
jgi:hypothetical protein